MSQRNDGSTSMVWGETTSSHGMISVSMLTKTMWESFLWSKMTSCCAHHHYHHNWQNCPFIAIAFLRRFCQICPFLGIRPSGFHFYGFHNNSFFYRARSSALRRTPNLEDQVSVLMSPSDTVVQLYPEAPDSFLSPSTTRRAAVKVF
jgi:hypothetical protein